MHNIACQNMGKELPYLRDEVCPSAEHAGFMVHPNYAQGTAVHTLGSQEMFSLVNNPIMML